MTCAPGVSAAAPTEVNLDGVNACSIVRVTLRIPAGHAGKTGIALGYGHQAVLPRTAGRFISGDDEVVVYDMSNYADGPQWQAFLINADTIPHTWEVRVEVDELVSPGAVPLRVPIDPLDLMAAGSAAVGAG